MRKTLGFLAASALLFVWTGLARSGDEAEARALVTKSIKAMGGEANLAKQKAMTWKEKGTYYGMGEGLPYTGIYAIQYPNQFRMEIEGVFTMVVNGDKGWSSGMGETKEMSKEELAAALNNQKAGWISSLLPLSDKAFSLAALGESKVEGQPALGIKVTRKDYPEVKLFFDKKTTLPVKFEFRTTSQEAKGKEVLAEHYMSDYKDVDGGKAPHKVKMMHDGKLFVEADIVEMKAVGKLDDKVFAKPGAK